MYASFDFIGLTVYKYGLWLGLGALAALALTGLLARARALPQGTAALYALIAVPLAVLCSRLLYCAVNLSFFTEVCQSPTAMLRFYDGGLSMSGAIIGLVAAAAICSRVLHARFASLMDALAAPIALFIAAARSAERFTELGIGKVVEAGWFTDNMPWLFIAERAGKSVEYRMAVYGYEAAAALIICAVMLILYIHHRGREGDAALCFFVIYGASQVLLESLRDDGHMMLIFLRVGQLCAAIAPFIVAGVLASRRRQETGGFDRCTLIIWIGLALCVCALAALEFSLDGRLTLGTPSPVRDYAIMLFVCVAMCALPLSLMRSARGMSTCSNMAASIDTGNEADK